MKQSIAEVKTIRVRNLLSRYQLAWEAWQMAVAGLRPADYESPKMSQRWNLKDVFGHLAAYMNLMARHLRSYQKRGRLVSGRAPSYSYFNRREAARRKKIPLLQVRAEFESNYREFIDRLAELNDDDLKKRFPSAWSSSTYSPALGTVLNEEARHIIAHAGEVKKWRERYHIEE